MEAKKISEMNKNWLTPIEKTEIESRDTIYYLNTTFKQQTEYTEDDRLKLNHDDQIDYRYQVVEEIGKGAFSNVYKCVDHKYDSLVAVKVIKNEHRYKRQSLIEFEIYDLFHKSDVKNDNILQLLKLFNFRDNLFIVYDIYGIDLYHYYKNNDTQKDVKEFGRQIANGLAFIHSFDIVHLDLKPENILVKNKRLKIIDFGSSSLFDPEKPVKYYAQSRYYRAPEMLFQTPYGIKSDIWSFGCILYELYTRRPLFPARSTFDLIIYYFHVLDYPDRTISWIYNNDSYLNTNKELFRYITRDNKRLMPGKFEWNLIEKSDKDLYYFIVDMCLCWRCEDRISAKGALIHSYFTNDNTDL
jgi:dual specificity tyrosine-phosphorylation-regulated kinase 2/3/4